MLLFSTILQINESLTKDAFIQLVIEWNQGSPHDNNVIPGIEWNGERNIRYGNDTLWMAIEEYRNQNIIAVRYEKTEEDGAVWDTDYVMNFNDMKMSICLYRSYLEEAVTVDSAFSTPHFITLLIDRGYLVPDGDLPISSEPVVISRDNLEILTDVINGKKKYRLPVVYVSRTFYDEAPVNVSKMARRLKGVAHVLVEEGTWLNASIRKACDNKNEYYGAIGVYYPNQTDRHRKYLYRSYERYDKVLLEKVVSSVIKYCNSQLIKTLYTWQGVSYALTRDRLASRREELLAAETAKRQAESKAAEAGAIVDSVSEEIEQYRKQIEELTHDNEVLMYENQGLRAKINGMEDQPILYLGDEDEFFPGEIKEMLLLALEEKLSVTDARTRKADVLKDIIDKNGGCHHVAEQKAQTLKSTLKGYKNVSATMKKMFTDLGFVITEEGKHYKLTYYGDGRYMTTLAKTPSDNRTGMNQALYIIKQML